MTGYHLYRCLLPEKPPINATATEIESRAGAGPAAEQNPPAAEILAADGRTMILVPATEAVPAFYTDRTPVTFHHYVEFLNQMTADLSVTDGLVKKGEDIWLYLGSGSEVYEQIIYDHGRFHLRDAAWAGRPVVRVTWLGIMAYTRHFDKAMPSYSQWQALVSQSTTVSEVPSSDPTNILPEPDPHAQMLAASSTDHKSPVQDALGGTAQNPTKEWIDYFPTDAAAGDRSAMVVLSHIADSVDPEMRSGQKAPLLRYPWESFADVGFRTVALLKMIAVKP